MKLAKLFVENFRGYCAPTAVTIDELTVFVGKNDAGKSSLLEALEIFFNELRPDRGDLCVHATEQVIRIGCAFTDLPNRVVLDSAVATELDDEFLLNANGELEIVKEWDLSGKAIKESVFAFAEHPTGPDVADLLILKNADLKLRCKKLNISADVASHSVNSEMRRAIRSAAAPLSLARTKLPLDKEDAKRVWEELKRHLPVYALFRSDRASHDGDDEVQSPLKFAIAEALRELSDDLKRIEELVRQRAEDVANRTLAKLREMDSDLAAELKPFFRADPKWDVFKFGLAGDNEIPINKRGSGVRRLILLNFFRAEAERKRAETSATDVIYAIEEPETSQHPDNQRMLVNALRDLSASDATQVIVTSHTPGIAGLVPSDSLRCVRKAANGQVSVSSCNEADLEIIAQQLGVLPDRRVRALVFVEGANDVEFFERASKLLKQSIPEVVDLSEDQRVAVIPLGGGSLKHWVAKHYLRNLRLPEVHIYDRDVGEPAKYQAECDAVNARGDGSWAAITSKRELENYLHPDAIFEGMDRVRVAFTSSCDVPLLVAKAVHEASGSAKAWDDVAANPEALAEKVKRAKRRLNREAAARMTVQRLREQDAADEIIGWLRRIGDMVA